METQNSADPWLRPGSRGPAELGSESRQATLASPLLPKKTAAQRSDMNSGSVNGTARMQPDVLTGALHPPLSSCHCPSAVWHPADPLPLCGPRGRGTLPACPAPASYPRGKALTGITRSRQMLKFFLWFGFSFLSENLVSPMNSLWPNLSSSQTEILRSTKGVGGGEERARMELLLGPESCDGCWPGMCYVHRKISLSS